MRAIHATSPASHGGRLTSLALVTLTLSAAGCWDQTLITTNTDLTSDHRGSLSGDAFTLSWQHSSSWTEGHCLDMTLVNQGRPVLWWTLTVAPDVPVDATYYTGGATFEFYEDAIVIAPEGDAALKHGDSAEFQMCVEPHSVPAELVKVEYDAEDTPTPTPTAEDPDRTPTEPDTPRPGEATEGSLPGSLKDGPIYLKWDPSVQFEGGRCLDLTVLNASEEDVTNWSLDVIMSETAGVLDSWGATRAVLWKGNFVRLIPADEPSKSIPAGEELKGAICLQPAAGLVDMTATITP